MASQYVDPSEQSKADSEVRGALEQLLANSKKYEFVMEPQEYLDWLVIQQKLKKKG